jgi:hypothetical protein
MVLIALSPAEFQQLGLELVGFNEEWQDKTCQATNLRRFRAIFGPSPETCSQMFEDLQTTNIEEARVVKPNPAYFMMSLNWLRTYKTEEEMAGQWGLIEQTVRDKVWKYTFAMAALKEAKVRFL